MGLDNTPGGIESFLFNISRHIDWDQFQFDFFCYGDNPAFKDELESLGARLMHLPDRKNILLYHKAIVQVSQQYDIVHLHKNSATDWLPLVWLKQCRLIVHSHNSAHYLPLPYRAMHTIGRVVYSRWHCMRLACSEKAGEWLFGHDTSFTVFPNSIEGHRFAFSESNRSLVRDELSIPGDSFVIGAVGRLVRQKNFKFLIEVFERVHSIHPDSYLVLVGSGEQRQMLQRTASDLGVQDSVLFLGARSDVDRLYSAFDCFCAPSIYEGFSIATLEAQFSGLRVFTSTLVPEEAIVTDLASVHALECDEWVNNLLEYMESGQLRKGLSIQERRSLQKYDIDTSISKLESIYRKLVNE